MHDLVDGGTPRYQTPLSCGYINDLYQVFEKGLEPDGVETWLGDNRDGPGAAAIETIVDEGKLPVHGSFAFRDLMRFISFAGVRSPAFKAVVFNNWAKDSDQPNRQNAFVREMLLNAKEV